MRAHGLSSVLGALLGLSVHASGTTADRSALNQAASLYHQARFDSARARLESLLADEGWRRRDSLMLFQYLGMACSRLGEDGEAVERFGRLLDLDSLFQFPRNEDAGILRNFNAARGSRQRSAARADGATRAGQDGMHRPGPALPHRLAAHAAGEPSAMGSPMGATHGTVPPPPEDPLPAAPAGGFGPPRKRMNLALGAVPLGGGWLARDRTGHAVTLALLQGGGMLLSLYASQQQSRARNDRWGLEEGREADMMVRWQWVQAVSLSTAAGAYLFSIFASGGD